MLHDHAAIQNVPGDLPRQWIVDETFDLIIWYDHGDIAGFQLCYDKRSDEHAFTWLKARGSTHARVDSGEDSPTANRTPILVANGHLPKARLLREFQEHSLQLRPSLRELIVHQIIQHRE